MQQRIINLLLVVIFALSCSSDKCSSVKDEVAMKLQEYLQCKNYDAIREDIAAYTPSCNKEKGLGCSLMVDPIVELAMDHIIPKERWGCELTRSKDQIKGILLILCATL